MLFGGRYHEKLLYSFSPSTTLWKRLQDLPTGRYYHGTVQMGDIYMVGGWDNKNLDRYDAKKKTFKTISSLKTGRCNFGICKYDDSSFIIAGGDDDYYTTRTSFVYDFTTDDFKPVGNLNTRRHGHALVNCMDRIYAIGGANNDANDGSLKTIEVFDKTTESWKETKSKLVIPRFYHCAVAHERFIFVVGGMQRDYLITNSIEKFDTSTGRVEVIKAKLRVPRCHFALAKLEESVIIIGGKIEPNTNKFTDSVEIFNLKSEKLYRGQSIPFADKGFSSCTL